jgi:Fungal specific transcription factor domain
MQSDDEFMANYFSTVHTWLPIIDQDIFQDSTNMQTPDPNHLLLLMCMHLIVQRPDSQPEQGIMDNEQYHATKQFYFNLFMNIDCTPSTKLLQSGVLLATYEYGHGMVGAACHTLSSCISASMALSLHQYRKPYSLDTDLATAWCQQDELRRVWWAIVISDRYVSCNLIMSLVLISHIPGYFVYHIHPERVYL